MYLLWLDSFIGGSNATFDLDLTVEADILPVIPGRVFDRMSISYLERDHKERGRSIYHFYLTYLSRYGLTVLPKPIPLKILEWFSGKDPQTHSHPRG